MPVPITPPARTSFHSSFLEDRTQDSAELVCIESGQILFELGMDMLRLVGKRLDPTALAQVPLRGRLIGQESQPRQVREVPTRILHPLNQQDPVVLDHRAIDFDHLRDAEEGHALLLESCRQLRLGGKGGYRA